jgi:hypothetical protein
MYCIALQERPNLNPTCNYHEQCGECRAYQAGYLPPAYPVPATMTNAYHAMYVQYAAADLDWLGAWPVLPVD